MFSSRAFGPVAFGTSQASLRCAHLSWSLSAKSSRTSGEQAVSRTYTLSSVPSPCVSYNPPPNRLGSMSTVLQADKTRNLRMALSSPYCLIPLWLCSPLVQQAPNGAPITRPFGSVGLHHHLTILCPSCTYSSRSQPVVQQGPFSMRVLVAVAPECGQQTLVRLLLSSEFRSLFPIHSRVCNVFFTVLHCSMAGSTLTLRAGCGEANWGVDGIFCQTLADHQPFLFSPKDREDFSKTFHL
uniref:Uncharacterized protein TCIL3000_11_14050 n=1 Tax=Trypanosoma congolense (strain IL3000) TaxID=1068625 RepID=G0V313_TRYCI|nr:unnamed protein product [Trypanosoma congolense IL3000]